MALATGATTVVSRLRSTFGIQAAKKAASDLAAGRGRREHLHVEAPPGQSRTQCNDHRSVEVGGRAVRMQSKGSLYDSFKGSRFRVPI